MSALSLSFLSFFKMLFEVKKQIRKIHKVFFYGVGGSNKGKEHDSNGKIFVSLMKRGI